MHQALCMASYDLSDFIIGIIAKGRHLSNGRMGAQSKKFKPGLLIACFEGGYLVLGSDSV